MPEWTIIPTLPTVECPVCHRLVVLPYSGDLVPFHWLLGRPYRRPCPGQGARVVDGVASLPPEPAEVPVS